MILDEERLRAERNDRKTWKSRVTGIEEFASNEGGGEPSSARRPRDRPQRAQRADEEDAEYKLAIEASKYQEEEDRKKRQSRGGDPDDDDLAKAIKLSKEEEELRRRELEDSNAHSLFDDSPVTAQPSQPQYTGFNQGYQQQGQVDWSGNPIDQNSMMQAQQTGFYNQPTGFQPQPTGYQNGFSNGFGQQQPNVFDSFGQQQQQASPFGAQPTGYNPYAQQTGFGQQPQAQQPEPIIPVATNNPWATTNQQSPLAPMQTGSNNPFASSIPQNRPAPSHVQSQPTLSTLAEQKTLSQFNNSSNFNPPTSFTPQPQKTQSPYEAKLSALLESGEGMDTFGNVGNLRIPAQHTAPGTFVNSAGAGLGRIHEQQTGNNPFLQNQFTGMPQTSYGAQPGFGGHQIPAATGPANFGHGSSNPFGQRQQQNGQGGGDLIQF